MFSYASLTHSVSFINNTHRHSHCIALYLTISVFQVLKMPTKFTEAFSGIRPKGAAVGNWLEYDSDYQTEAPASYTERIEAFRQGRV